MSERRRFNSRERTALYLAADGRCARCGAELAPGWHGDHVTPWSKGGETDVTNGQALCPMCNVSKGDRVTQLRRWQQDAIDKFYAAMPTDYLVSATPGAGKTTFGLELARRLADEGTVRRIAVIVPTDSLRQQWADAAGRVGIPLMPVSDPGDYEKSGYIGYVATYAQLVGVGADMARRAARVPTVALLDEIHHAGDTRSWGDALTRAMGRAMCRIALTGTPWRQDKTSPIPFVRYDGNGTVVVDAGYEYGEAVADGVCRPIEFRAYAGDAKWLDCGEERTASLGDDLADDDVPAVLDAVLDPNREWIPGLLSAAADALAETRQEIADAGGLVIAHDMRQARAYAALLERITGEPAAVALSDDPQAKLTIDQFRTSRRRWLVAVRMVSEGVDIPRLAVGVYAARTRTPLFFRQVVGRFVRTRPSDPEFNAALFMPNLKTLMGHARDIENELRHQLEVEQERESRERSEPSDQAELPLRTVLGASEATFDQAIYKGGEISPEEMHRAEERCRAWGVPLAYASNIAVGMRSEPTAAVAVSTSEPEQQPRHRVEKMLRAECNRLAGKIAYRAGVEKREVNTDLRRRGFPARSKASVEQLEQVRDYLTKWLAELA